MSTEVHEGQGTISLAKRVRTQKMQMESRDANELTQIETPDVRHEAPNIPDSTTLAKQMDGPLDEQLIQNELKTIYDPEIPVNIVDLGLIYASRIVPLELGGNRIEVEMTLTAPGCGMASVLKATAESKLSRLPEVKEVRVNIVFDPPWHQGLMSEAAKLQLGL
jgi:metal-sulfur cluster biosynthetic enzyme